MKKILLLAAVMISFSTFAQNPKKHYKAAQKFAKDQLFDEALNELNEAIKYDGSYTQAFVMRGNIYEQKKNWEQSVKDYEIAAKLDPNSVGNLLNAGKLNYIVKDYPDAKKYLSEAAFLNSKNFEVLQYKSFTHIKLGEFYDAVLSIDEALNINQTYLCYYSKAVANDSLQNYSEAITNYTKTIEMNAQYAKAYFALSLAYLNNKDIENALKIANSSVQKFNAEGRAYEVRSIVHHANGDFANAINDLSKLETMIDDNTKVLYTRGRYYFEYEQYLNARSDFEQLLSKSNEYNDAAYWNGRASEELMAIESATNAYNEFIESANKNQILPKLVADATTRIYTINKEEDMPVIVVDTPLIIDNLYLAVLNNATRITIKGKIEDASDIDSLSINDETILLDENNYFTHNMSVADINTIAIKATDIYSNESVIDYSIKNVEIDAPLVFITTPYAGDNGEIYLDSDDENLFIEGRIEDASAIADIFINDIRASFNDTEKNPTFTATVNIFNKGEIRVKAVDEYNNIIETTFTLNREGAEIAEGNPMGKTWVIFIENSNYELFASLEGPTKDVSTMKAALNNYQVHNFIHKKDMSKKDMERFFSIELRDQVKKNNVNSLMVWYAGHGKFINETGYWIPIDATRDDEFTYFNINSLKAGMQSYSNFITHTLVVTDACESGPSFYQAMRDDQSPKSCDDVSATKFKSSQVFSSAGYELASDDSQFTKTFAKSLQFNDNACIPIESVVIQVTQAVKNDDKQKPQFGKIAGFEDENGTFFFIKK